ncbi:MAG: hypothetical protein N2445_08550, partial [Acidobacteria bacterium]|nr:hypothetical protein [Acidobacteriota bacterium]
MAQDNRLTVEEIQKLRDFIREETGFDLENYKDEFIKRRFLPRAVALGLNSLEGYLAFLKKNEKEREIAKRKIFVPTTEFFRNREVFDAVKNILETDFDGSNSLIVASAPCSTGEESFSLAIVLEELEKDYSLFAIDGNLQVLKSLKNRKFTQKNLAPLYKNEIKRYFNEEGSIFSLKEEILSRVFPIQADLTLNFPLKNVDIVFMRNFFIYLKEKTFLNCVKYIE